MTYISGDGARLPLLPEEESDLEAFASDAMRFIPVELRVAYPTIRQPDRRRAFQLSPVSPTILFPQEASDAQPPAFRNDLDIRDVAEHLEVHAVFPGSEYQIGRAVKMSTKSDGALMGGRRRALGADSSGAEPAW